MNNHLFAAVEAGLIIVVVFGLAIWQLVAVRRGIKRDRRNAESRETHRP